MKVRRIIRLCYSELKDEVLTVLQILKCYIQGGSKSKTLSRIIIKSY